MLEEWKLELDGVLVHMGQFFIPTSGQEFLEMFGHIPVDLDDSERCVKAFVGELQRADRARNGPFLCHERIGLLSLFQLLVCPRIDRAGLLEIVGGRDQSLDRLSLILGGFHLRAFLRFEKALELSLELWSLRFVALSGKRRSTVLCVPVAVEGEFS